MALATFDDYCPVVDICDRLALFEEITTFEPDLIYHLAAAKHAPEGEIDPTITAEVNIEGTENVLEAAKRVKAKVVVASTCKAADPETVYGATKLIAERLTLNAGQVVARFYNVPETCGNVFELWRNLSPDEPIPYTDCQRYFMSRDRAVRLLRLCANLPSGRYALSPGMAKTMQQVALELYPDRPLVEIPRRRGDRQREPLCAHSERIRVIGDGLMAIESPHDPKRSEVPA